MRITVLGAGAWGTALALACSAKHSVTLWARQAEQIRAMQTQSENRRFLPGHRLPDTLGLSNDFSAALKDSELLILAMPVSGLRSTLIALREADSNTPFLWLCKGLEAGSAQLPHQIVAAEIAAPIRCGALSGPSFAAEVAQGLPTALTLAADDREFARTTAHALHNSALRIYTSDDVPGVEVGGAVKNVMAIASGICDGLGLGLNARAALITRGLAEMARLGAQLGAAQQTFMGLTGMGDLILTCTGSLSRNRRVGLELAAGKPLVQILSELGHVAEGVSSTREVARLAQRFAIEMPISQAINAILYEQEPVATAVEKLLNRDAKIEAC
ncbi:MAG: NAD(P)H-dependent glycerol-3-phosphate dehydrogenase [Pseudomonadota bacterium]